MACRRERSSFNFEVRPVPVYTVNQNVSKLHARFLMHGSNVTESQLEDYARAQGLPKVAIEGHGIFSENEPTLVTISSPFGGIVPRQFPITQQDLLNSNGIYSQDLKLEIYEPQLLEICNPFELSIKLSTSNQGEIAVEKKFLWPCFEKNTTINVGPNSTGIQYNSYYDRNENSSASPSRFLSSSREAADVSDHLTSTPHPTAVKLIKPTPVRPPSPISEKSTSPYYTPPESVEASPVQAKNVPDTSITTTDKTFTPIRKLSLKFGDESTDSGVSSMLSNLSIQSRISQTPTTRFYRNSASDISCSLSNPTSPIPTPTKSRRPQSVPNTPAENHGPLTKRPHSSRRRLCPPDGKVATPNKKPPWRP